MIEPVNLLRSGWSFFFRYPNTHTDRFSPQGIYLGPILQAAVFVSFAWIAEIVTPSNRSFHPQFLAMVFLSALTGFFHEDGLADTLDGFGVPSYGRTPERQAKIRGAMKDSRLGTYGVTALALLWILRFAGLWTPSVTAAQVGLMVMVSRSIGLLTASALVPWADPSQERQSGLGQHMLSGIRPRVRLFWGLALIGFIGFAFVLTNVPTHWILLFILSFLGADAFLRYTMQRNGHLCGDLIGASICLTEMFFLVFLL